MDQEDWPEVNITLHQNGVEDEGFTDVEKRDPMLQGNGAGERLEEESSLNYALQIIFNNKF